MLSSEFNLQKVKCAGCVGKIQTKLNQIAGITSAQVNLLDKTLLVEYSKDKLDELVIAEVSKLGFGASLESVSESQSNLWLSVGVPLISGMLLMTLGMLPALMFDFKTIAGFGLGLFYALASLLIICGVGGQIIKSGWNGLITLNFNMHSLILLGVSSAWFYSTGIVFLSHFSKMAIMQHVYFESALIIIGLINLGAHLEERAKTSTTTAIKALTQLVPLETTLMIDGVERLAATNLLRTGDLVKIRPGEQIPADGLITLGAGYLDESMLTGEPLPVRKEVGAKIIGGSINTSGAFIFEITQIGENTLLAGIINLVKTAQLSKPKLAKLADQVAKVFVPSIIFIALASGLIWYLFAAENQFYHAIAVFMTVLLIACPCSVGLAIPVALMVGVGRGASQGVLIRDASCLSIVEELNVVVLDKTGTITLGKPQVIAVTLADNSLREDVLPILHALEVNSEHPLATTMVTYCAELGSVLPVDNFASISGSGVRGEINGKVYSAGSAAWIRETARINLDLLVENSYSQIYLAQGAMLLARIDIADIIKHDSLAAIEQFKQNGLRVIMLTGDNQASAENIAAQVGIGEIYANCKPDDKLALIKKLQAENQKVIFVGDGINDAPSLIQADLGVAIGGGTDIAMHSAAITLMRDSLSGVTIALNLASKINLNMRQNLFGSFIYNSLAVLVAAGILYPFWHIELNPIIASVVMSLSSLTVIFNALRLRYA